MDVRARQRLPEGSTPGALLGALRTHRPLVHCITNRIANTYTANALLALGASPCMVDQPGQAEQFVTSADALLINTASAPGERVRSSLRTAWTASRTGVRWVLDPVGYGTIPAEDFADALL